MKLKYLLFGVIAFPLLSCEPIDDCTKEEFATSIIYNFPDSLAAGTGYDLSIHYIIENSCGSFVEFSDSIYGTTTQIKTKLLYEGCNCSLQFVEDSNTYYLVHDSAGIYTYEFLVGDSDFDSYVLTVY